ncbi:ATP-binding domain-containing protein, partial [Staphylococcus aureus]
IFNEFNKDEIILCLNYDGIYGINNINRLLQANNKNDSVIWGVKEYKVGDPILFNETNKYSPILFNNLKGSIIEIHVFEEYILFDLEINKVINELDIISLEIDLISSSENSSVIRIRVEKSDGLNDDDNDSSDSIVPFQVSYAISIHKAQGLEFNSVKIVISDDLDEQITNNIFYTAITRARENLKIYWSPRTEKKIIDNIISKRNLKDLSILKSRIKKQNT